MKTYLVIIQLIISGILIALILLQSKGVGLGRSFGGKNDFFSTKRGVEKAIFNLTIIFSLIFIISSIVQILIF